MAEDYLDIQVNSHGEDEVDLGQVPRSMQVCVLGRRYMQNFCRTKLLKSMGSMP